MPVSIMAILGCARLSLPAKIGSPPPGSFWGHDGVKAAETGDVDDVNGAIQSVGADGVEGEELPPSAPSGL